MKKRLLFITLLTTTTLFAKPGTKGFGAGVILGDPTALSAKYFLSNDTAFDGGLSFGHHELLIYGDYLRHFKGLLGNQNEFVRGLTPYVGVGPVFAFADGSKDHGHHFIGDDNDDFAFGARIPLGVEWIYQEIPVGVSLEIAPGATIIPETNGFVQGGLAVRYYF